MILKIQEAEFKNEALKTILLALAEELPTFEIRKKGSAFKGIFLALAETYPEDRAVIYGLLSPSERRRKKREGPLPRVYHGGKTRTTTNDSNCEGCPDAVSGTGDRKTTNPTIGAEAFTDVDAVLDRFEDNALAIMAYAQTQGIVIPPSVSKADTAAKYIVKHYQALAEQEEQNQDQ